MLLDSRMCQTSLFFSGHLKSGPSFRSGLDLSRREGDLIRQFRRGQEGAGHEIAEPITQFGKFGADGFAIHIRGGIFPLASDVTRSELLRVPNE